MIKIKQKGDFSKTEKYLKSARKIVVDGLDAHHIADKILIDLKNATPVYTGLTRDSWDYTITKTNSTTTILFSNRNIQNGANVVLLLEYGHGTSNGGWVDGKEFIHPIVSQNYLDIVNKTWKELSDL